MATRNHIASPARVHRRNTEQRRVLRDIAAAAAGPLSAQEFLDAAQSELPSIGIATVYRNLTRFVEQGELRAVELPGEASRYELADKLHHHHFQCDDCGRVIDVEGCSDAFESLLPESFRIRSHDVLIHGKCPQCP